MMQNLLPALWYGDLERRGARRRKITGMMKGILVVGLAVICLATPRDTARIGDRLQVFLPILAWACSARDGRAGWFFGRYLVLEAGIKIPKYALGDAPMNRRPDGGRAGFPSGHTAAASFGATSLALSCFKRAAPVQALAILGAGYTGASRVDAGRHTVWQAVAGAFWGWFSWSAKLIVCDRAFGALCAAIARRMRFKAARRG